MSKKNHHIPGTTIAMILFYLFLVLVSVWLMFFTFQYDPSTHSMILSSKVWSDFGAHIPLIRSFSFGQNIPPEYPLFPGEPIRYHYLFYAATGLLERIGLRIDIALNILSSIGFFLMLLFSYLVAKTLFNRRSVGILAVIFILFNGTLSFLNLFSKYPTITAAMNAIPHIQQFPSFGPWDNNLVTAFGNLNVYTNQRHLGLSFAIVLIIVYLLLRISNATQQHVRNIHIKRWIIYTLPNRSVRSLFILESLAIAVLTSSLLFINQAAVLPAVILIAAFFIWCPKVRSLLLLSFLCSIPFLLLFITYTQEAGQPLFELGYLIKKPVTIIGFLQFWFYNLGLHSIFIVLGMIIAPKKYRWLAIPFLVIFILPNLYRFSTDMINNHKFFNLFMIFGSMYAAYAVIRLAIYFKNRLSFRPLLLFIPALLFFMTFSGIIDFFVIANDYFIPLSDVPANKDASYIGQMTHPDAVILNSTWFYHPASIAGRKIYSGYSFFTWSAGYDTYKREEIVKRIYQTESKETACSMLKHEQISFVELNSSPEDFLQPISTMWLTMTPIFYENPNTGVKLFSVNDICNIYR
jgi:hypothetical protein